MGLVAFKAEDAGASARLGGNLYLADEPDQFPAPDLSVRIHNLDEIGWAFGPGAALAASDHVRTFLTNKLRDREPFGSVEYVLRQLSEHPVAYDGQRFHLFVSLAPTGEAKDCASKVMPTVYGNPAFPDDAWCRHYRADMALAVTLFEAMAKNRLVLAWQPVCSTDDPSQILYHECLLRIVTAGGQVEAAGPALEALERLGLVRALDRHVFAAVLRELHADPARKLGVNVSAQSLVRDHWWSRHLAQLAANPWLSRRLFLEVTETAPMASATQATDFISAVRQRGCQIVLDDFGTGHAAFRLLLSLKPDIAKIDRFFVHHAKASSQGFDALVHLIGLAESLGAIAIVEGVETATDSALVHNAGARWQQGFHLGRPSISRPWRMKADAWSAHAVETESEGDGRPVPKGTGASMFEGGSAGAANIAFGRYQAGGKPGDPHGAAISATGEKT